MNQAAGTAAAKAYDPAAASPVATGAQLFQETAEWANNYLKDRGPVEMNLDGRNVKVTEIVGAEHNPNAVTQTVPRLRITGVEETLDRSFVELKPGTIGKLFDAILTA